MSRLERAKVWAKAHKEDLMVGGMFAGLGVATVAMFVLIYKADVAASERRTAELNKAIDELNEWYSAERAINKALAMDNQVMAEQLDWSSLAGKSAEKAVKKAA